MNPYQQRLRDRYLKALSERKLKLTKPRKAVIELLLRKRNWHFQAEDMLREINEKSPGVVSRATVYRTLETLVEAAVLTRTRVRANSYVYELVTAEEHHHHLVDIHSGAIAEFAGDKELHRMLKRVCLEHGFTEHHHVLEVFGEFDVQPRRKG